MDESDRKPDETAPSYSSVMARAIASATVFGLLGGWLGKWLGRRGNTPASDLAKPFMKWSMAGFWALLAAYCSIKASDTSDKQAQQTTAPASPPQPQQDVPELIVEQVSDKKIPLSVVQSAGAETKGEVAPLKEKQRA